MDSQVLHVMTISNSIIGVSLLAMPYCFKQCGIILSILILIISSIISRLSCHLLLKSAIIARRRTFEVLAFHTFGSFGKFMTELGIIGFLIGTCIAFFVIMGDLGPTIVAKMTGTTSSDTMRTSILMALALFCVLPLGLLRNIDSLSTVCTATIGFYFCLVVKIIAEAVPHLFTGDWIDKVELWRPSGILQCLPIFSMALSCQTQIFEIYQVVQNASLEKMNNLIRVAINICSCVYIFVGTFGYIAFSNQTFTGNILMSFSSTFLSDAIKIGFVLSVAFSFPLVIFPCRASLNSLLYKQVYSLHEGTDKYIPEGRFKAITFVIILIPLVIGIMIPNIELVLGLMGSTIGILICVIFPAICFICTSTKNTNERVLAQIMLLFGLLIMVLGTYANLFAIEGRLNSRDASDSVREVQNIPKAIDIPLATKLPDIPKNIELKLPETIIDKAPDSIKPAKVENSIVRHEPPEPQAPIDSNSVRKSLEKPVLQKVEDVKLDVQNNNDELLQIKNVNLPKVVDSNHEPLQPQEVFEPQVVKESSNKISNQEETKAEKPVNLSPDISNDIKLQDIPKPLQETEVRHEPPQPIEPFEPKLDKSEELDNKLILDSNKVAKVNQIPIEPKEADHVNLDVELSEIDKLKKEQVLDVKDPDKQAVAIEAIKKEDKELLEQEKAALTEEERKNLQLLKTLEEQNRKQQELVVESKKVLDEIKLRQHVLEEKKQKVIEKEKQVLLEIDKEKVIKRHSGENQETIKSNKENPLPIPIMLSNALSNKEVPEIIKQDSNAMPQSQNQLNIVETKKEPPNDELPALDREIRSANTPNIEDTKEACDSKKKQKHREQPAIKMDMKLSNPEVVDIKSDLTDFSGNIDSKVVKSVSRDSNKEMK